MSYVKGVFEVGETPHIWSFLKYNDYSAPSGPRHTLYFWNGQIFVVSPTLLSLCVNCIRLFLCDNALHDLGSYKMLCFNNNRIKGGKVDASKMHLSLPDP